MKKFYINKLEIDSNSCTIGDDNAYKELYDKLKFLSKDYLNFKLIKDPLNGYYIRLEFSPQFFYTQSKHDYNNIVDYKKMLKNIDKIQKIVKSIRLKGLNPIMDWKLSKIEISMDISLSIPYCSYIDVIKSINPKRRGCYSLLVDYDNGATICFSSSSDNDSIPYKSHIRFENKIRLAKSFNKEDKEFDELKENILQCTLMIPLSKIQPSKVNDRKIAVPDFGSCFVGIFYPVDLVRLGHIITDYYNSLKKCSGFFKDILAKYLFHEKFELCEELKDDTKLLDKIGQSSGGRTESHILYFIIIKLLSELKDYSLAKISNFLSAYPKASIRSKRKSIINNIQRYRENYRDNFKAYSTGDLFAEIKGGLLLPQE